MQKIIVIEKVEIFHILTDTDSTALKFVFFSDLNSDVSEEKSRDIIFKVIIVSKIYKRFYSSHEFWVEKREQEKKARLLRNRKYW